MNKAVLLGKLIDKLHRDLASQVAAAQLARDEAISEESRPESKYDTHSQEAAYLAEGQARIAAEIQASIASYQTMAPTAFSFEAPIALGALVELKTRGDSNWYFIGPSAGGAEIVFEGKAILVVTPQSPLGQQLIGRRQGASLLSAGRVVSERQIIAQVV